jgi:predicted MPP superfamily phosphohydrolase
VRPVARVGAAAALAGVAGLGYMLFEAQRVRRVERDVLVPDLPQGLDGLLLAQLSDMHLGFRASLNVRATRKAFALAVAARPELILISGDLAGGPANLAALARLLATLRAPLGVYAVLGNHDHGASKVPFAREVELVDLGGVRLLQNETVTVERGDARLQVSGIDDWKHGFADLPRVLGQLDHSAGTGRLLLSHYGEAVLATPPGTFALTLSGDTHGGQICLPWFGGPVMLSQPHARFKDGLYQVDGQVIHITRGIGTSLLPFRFLCRPEVVLLRLRRAAPA